jgi:hypothetical protein
MCGIDYSDSVNGFGIVTLLLGPKRRMEPHCDDNIQTHYGL